MQDQVLLLALRAPRTGCPFGPHGSQNQVSPLALTAPRTPGSPPPLWAHPSPICSGAGVQGGQGPEPLRSSPQGWPVPPTLHHPPSCSRTRPVTCHLHPPLRTSSHLPSPPASATPKPLPRAASLWSLLTLGIVLAQVPPMTMDPCPSPLPDPPLSFLLRCLQPGLRRLPRTGGTPEDGAPSGHRRWLP